MLQTDEISCRLSTLPRLPAPKRGECRRGGKDSSSSYDTDTCTVLRRGRPAVFPSLATSPPRSAECSVPAISPNAQVLYGRTAAVTLSWCNGESVHADFRKSRQLAATLDGRYQEGEGGRMPRVAVKVRVRKQYRTPKCSDCVRRRAAALSASHRTVLDSLYGDNTLLELNKTLAARKYEVV